jgi:trigger factor
MVPLPMQINVQRLSPVMLEFEVEVPADTVKTEVDKAYANLSKKARLRGFRPGKAPRSVLSHLFGPQVQNDVAKAIVEDTLPKALSEKNVTPVNTPSVEPGKLDVNAAFTYKARFEVQPEIAEVKYEGFELVRPKVAADEKMVEEQLESLRQRHATLRAPDPARAAKEHDVVTIDFVLSIEGKPVKDGGGQGVQLELGSGQVLPELDAALRGKNPGEKLEVEATLPENHPKPEFRKKKAAFAVTVQDVKEKVLPTLDDEFAKDVGNFQTLIELRADIHTKLEKAFKDQADTAVAEQLVEKLNEANPLDVPPSLVEQQCRVMEAEFAMQARRMGQRITEDGAKALHDRIHAEAEKKVRAGLLMAAIAKKNDFKVTDQDVEKAFEELAQETGKNVAKVKADYRDPNRRNVLLGMILEDKILDFLESKSKIVERDPKAEAAKKDDAPKDEPKKKESKKKEGAKEAKEGT